MVGKQLAFLEEHQLGVVFAEGMLRLQVELRFEAVFLSFERFFDLGKQVIAAIKKLHRLGQFVNDVAEGVFECPGEADDAW